MRAVLGLEAVASFVRKHPGWMLQGDAIYKTFQFSSFPKAVKFIEDLVDPSEKMNHHPDVLLSYTSVRISLITHDSGGITQDDLNLASEIDDVYSSGK